MAKTPGKTSFVVSQPMMMGGGKDYQKSGQNVRGITDGIGVEGGRRQNTSPDSYQEPFEYVMDQYRQLRSRLGLVRDTISAQELLNRAGLRLSLVERDWNTVFGLMRNGNVGGFVVRGQNDLLRNLNSAGLDLEQAYVRMGPRAVTSLADQDLFAYLFSQLSMYRASLLSIGINPTDNAWDYLWNMRASYDPNTRASQESWNEPSVADAREKAMNPVNTWVKQTGFEAPSPLAPTKGSKGIITDGVGMSARRLHPNKWQHQTQYQYQNPGYRHATYPFIPATQSSKGILGNCSTSGQVVTGLVVGGAIFALYKTCKK